jgi:hypothetical protein
LRQRFIEDLQLRNRAPDTIEAYVLQVARFAKHFGRSPEQLGPEQIRAYQLHLLARQVSWSTFNQCICALRFLSGQTLGQREPLERLRYGRIPQKLPMVLAQEEVLELLGCVTSRHRGIDDDVCHGLARGGGTPGVADIDPSSDDDPGARGKTASNGWYRSHRLLKNSAPGARTGIRNGCFPVGEPVAGCIETPKAVAQAGLKSTRTRCGTFATELLGRGRSADDSGIMGHAN